MSYAKYIFILNLCIIFDNANEIFYNLSFIQKSRWTKCRKYKNKCTRVQFWSAQMIQIRLSNLPLGWEKLIKTLKYWKRSSTRARISPHIIVMFSTLAVIRTCSSRYKIYYSELWWAEKNFLVRASQVRTKNVNSAGTAKQEF